MRVALKLIDSSVCPLRAAAACLVQIMSDSATSVAIPGATSMNRSRSKSLTLSPDLNASAFSPPLVPFSIPIPSSDQPKSSTGLPSGPTSPLSASLKAFSTLALSPPTTLESKEFQEAFRHARSASFSSSTRPIVIPDPGMSNSPTSSAVSDLLPTPSSSPQSAPLPPTSIVGTKSTRTSQIKGNLGGVCEKEEYALAEDDSEENALGVFSDGARWGWPPSKTSPSNTNGPTTGVVSSSPPRSAPATTTTTTTNHTRRASLPASTLNNMAPLGRVVSGGSAAAGASANTTGSASTTSGSNNGFGLFRRLSVGGFTSRPKPPSPPSSSYASSPPSIPASLPPAPVSSSTIEEPRGRKSLGPSKSTKRKISPFGERMLHGMHH